jgi:trans-2,3-dihydro-3-hydroxyanthranilate isomerase
MREYRFTTLDVFASAPFGGNPLAVFMNAEGMSDDEMQSIAAEMNYSETTFVTPPADARNSATVRIFTPRNEVPFAGHPNVGTGVVLARLLGQRSLRLEERAGTVAVEASDLDTDTPAATIQAPRAFTRDRDFDVKEIADCLSIPVDEIDVGNHAPTLASVGLPFVIAELRSLDALHRCAPNYAAFEECDRLYKYPDDRFSVYAYVRTSETTLESRMFAPLSGILEDAATGSAAGAVTALVASLTSDAVTRLSITQGVAMGRPSYLEAEAIQRGDTIERVTITGRCVFMIEGVLRLPDR